MPLEAWFPIGFTFPNGHSSRLPVHEGGNWQLYTKADSGSVLVVKDILAEEWFSANLLPEKLMDQFVFAEKTYFSYACEGDYVLLPLSFCPSPDDKNEALAFAEALRASRECNTDCSFNDAIYVEKLSRLLPTNTLSAAIKDDVILGSYLTGGVGVSVNSFRRLSSLMSWMEPDSIKDVIERSGIKLKIDVADIISEDLDPKVTSECKEPFELPGRSDLEGFFNEHVVDIIINQERYKALGITFPSSIILHGPPGCGKTFAVERLVEHLGWPSFSIEASSVASPYIHETSKKVAEVFEQAIANAPAILIIDEMEAFLADRKAAGAQHRVEEVAEFLRRIPEANENEVLVVAMTNHIEMIDQAIQRRGRFDHVVEVGMASEEEVTALLKKLLSELPAKDNVNVETLAAELTGRPLSDVTFVVREGARLAARSGENKIGQENLISALESTPARNEDKKPRRKIGFVP